MPIDVEKVATMVYFGALGGRIEGRYVQQKKETVPAVLILPPDPRYKGSIDNSVIKMLESVFQECNFTTLAINYQGCGRSEGCFRSTLDGLVTASIALDWLQAQNTEASHFWIAGYSFGAYIAADLAMRRPEIENFVFVSPLIKQYDFSFMCPSLCDGLFVCGENDELVDCKNLNGLCAKMNEGCNVDVSYITIGGAKHRYEGKLDQLKAEIKNYINIKLATRIPKPVKKKRRKRQKKDPATAGN